MKLDRLDEMVGGWFVGDFTPNVMRDAGFEVAVKRYSAGDAEGVHHHRVATEITVIVSGRARMFDQTFGPGDIITIEPGEATGFEALDDVVTVVVKRPSAHGDKYAGRLD